MGDDDDDDDDEERKEANWAKLELLIISMAHLSHSLIQMAKHNSWKMQVYLVVLCVSGCLMKLDACENETRISPEYKSRNSLMAFIWLDSTWLSSSRIAMPCWPTNLFPPDLPLIQTVCVYCVKVRTRAGSEDWIGQPSCQSAWVQLDGSQWPPSYTSSLRLVSNAIDWPAVAT